MDQKEIPLFKVFMADTVIKELEKVLYSGFIGEGPKVVAFERMISEKFNCPYVLGLNCGTSGLHLAFQMITNYDPKAEIIVSPMTCSATLTPMIAVRSKIVWADIDSVSGNIDPLDVERKITENTKAIVAVHWGGNPCDMLALNALGRKYSIKVVEDAAHAIGAKINGEYIGCFSDFTMFSLQAIKHVTSVDGGLLVCAKGRDYRRAKLLRWYGIDRTEHRQVSDLRCELDIAEAGHKMHMNDVCAAVGMENFKHLNDILVKHRDNARYYDEKFIGTHIGIVPPIKGGESAYWLYTIHVNNREELMARLKENGIGASKVHARNDTHSMFGAFKSNLPCVNKFNATHLCVPVGWWIDETDRERIADLVLRYAR
jgi:dTDP-4-amino-4,6-dideoxygalactose transaminase